MHGKRIGLTHLHIRLPQALVDVAACVCSRQNPVEHLELSSSRLSFGQSCHGGLRGVLDPNPVGGRCSLLSRLSGVALWDTAEHSALRCGTQQNTRMLLLTT